MKSSLVIGVLLVLFVAYNSVFVIDEGELGLVTQFGEYKRTADAPGLYFMTPFVQTVTRMERRIMGSDTPPAEYLTLDKKRLVADPVTRWRVVDPLSFFKTVQNEVGAKARLDDMVNSEMRRELASRNFGDIIGNARDPMMVRVAAAVREQTKEFGVEIVDIRIKRADLPKEVQESVYARMRAERDRVAKQYRSEGEEEAQKIRADTDKEKVILLAQAYETAEKARGEGDAEGTGIYAAAYGKDPEFYSFIRSLDAYEKAIGADTSLVLSTGSDLFKFLSK